MNGVTQRAKMNEHNYNDWPWWSWKHTCPSCEAARAMVDDLRRKFEGAEPEYEIVRMYQKTPSIKRLLAPRRIMWWYGFFMSYRNARCKSIGKAIKATYGCKVRTVEGI